jgi:hypothetical protein
VLAEAKSGERRVNSQVRRQFRTSRPLAKVVCSCRSPFFRSLPVVLACECTVSDKPTTGKGCLFVSTVLLPLAVGFRRPRVFYRNDRTASFLQWLPRSLTHVFTTPKSLNHDISASAVVSASAVMVGTRRTNEERSSLSINAYFMSPC